MREKPLVLLVTLMLLTNILFLSTTLVKATEWHIYPGQSKPNSSLFYISQNIEHKRGKTVDSDFCHKL